MRQRLPWIVAAVVVLAVRALVAGLWTDDPQAAPVPELAPSGQGSPSPLPVRTAGVHLVPMDGVPEARVRRVAVALSRQLDVGVRILPRLRSEVGDLDAERGQLDADSLLGRLESAFPSSGERRAIIAITDGDLRWAAADWKFTFGVRGDGYGVISHARMDPANLGEGRNDRLLELRLRKMVTRFVGELLFGLPRSENPDSVLAPTLAGVEELDRMGLEFCPPRPGERLSC